MMILYLLCRPAKAWELCSVFGSAEVYQVSAWSTCQNFVADHLNQCRLIARFHHRASSRHVLVFNCVMVLAVTTPERCGRVDMAQRTSQATWAVFPMPWPEAMASRRFASGLPCR